MCRISVSHNQIISNFIQYYTRRVREAENIVYRHIGNESSPLDIVTFLALKMHKKTYFTKNAT